MPQPPKPRLGHVTSGARFDGRSGRPQDTCADAPFRQQVQSEGAYSGRCFTAVFSPALRRSTRKQCDVPGRFGSSSSNSPISRSHSSLRSRRRSQTTLSSFVIGPFIRTVPALMSIISGRHNRSPTPIAAAGELSRCCLSRAHALISRGWRCSALPSQPCVRASTWEQIALSNSSSLLGSVRPILFTLTDFLARTEADRTIFDEDRHRAIALLHGDDCFEALKREATASMQLSISSQHPRAQCPS